MAKSNKINVYLVKNDVKSEDIFDKKYLTRQVDGGVLHYNKKDVHAPEWVHNFFNNNDALQGLFKAASSQAVFIKSIKIGKKLHTFAITFGTGYHMLNRYNIVPNFGLKIVLNIIDVKNIRKVDTHNISSVPKHKSEQIARPGDMDEFSVNIDTDILTSITGKIEKSSPLHEFFGSSITGKDTLSANAKFDAETVDAFLEKSYKCYNSDEYKKKGFGWIDNIAKILPNDLLLLELNKQLDADLANLKNNRDKIWIAVPEIIKWEDIEGFRYNNKKQIYDDLDIDDLPIDKYTVENLKKIVIRTIKPDGSLYGKPWDAFQCLYAEIDFKGNKYMLINSNWYKIEADFVSYIDKKITTLFNRKVPAISWPKYDPAKSENTYNLDLTANIKGSVCMDAKNIIYGGGKSKEEFCDVFDINGGNIIHVKKYSGSSVLSHLFNQGYVSAELLLADSKFKAKVEDKVNLLMKRKDFSFPQNVKFNVVFAILSSKEPKNAKNLPFFSKVVLNSIAARIDTMKGYNVFIKVIPQ